jgi:hypothetical protein
VSKPVFVVLDIFAEFPCMLCDQVFVQPDYQAKGVGKVCVVFYPGKTY